MTFGEQLYEALAAARTRNGGTIQRKAWEAIAQELHDRAVRRLKKKFHFKLDRSKGVDK